MCYTIALNFEDGITRFVDCRKGEKVLDAAFRNKINLPGIVEARTERRRWRRVAPAARHPPVAAAGTARPATTPHRLRQTDTACGKCSSQSG